MSVYARADLASVTVSSAHGGCGLVHSRPAPGGNPVAVWKLDCSACEKYLRQDPLWSATVSEIPETPDQKLTREDWEKRGVKDRDNVLALALGKLAGVELPDTIRMPIAGQQPHLPAIAGMLVCANGHDCEPGSKFCAECGGPVRIPVPMASCPQGHQVAATSKFCPECGSPILRSAAAELEPPAGTIPLADLAPQPEPANGARKKPLKDWRAEDLKALAREKGLDDSGTRTDVLARLREAA